MIPVVLAISLVVFRVSAESNSESQYPCDGVIFRGTYYEKDLLFTNLQKPTNLLVHYGSLFFSHTITNGTKTDTSIMSCHIKNEVCKDINGVPGGRTITYDRWSSVIYFGGRDGIYRYRAKTNELKFFANNNNSILGVAFRRNVVKFDHTTHQLYAWVYSKYWKIKNVMGVEVDNFFVTRTLDIYFYNKTGLYVIDKQTKLATILSDKIIVRQIIEDIDGDVFFGAKDGIYIYDLGIENLKKVAEIDNVYGLTFARAVTSYDAYQFLYSDENSIYVLFPSHREERCESVLNKSGKPQNNLL